VALGIREPPAVNASRRRFLRASFLGAGPAPVRPPWALPESGFLAACTRCDACARACPTGIVARGDGGYPEVTFRSGGCTFCGACAAACAPGALSGGGAPWRLQPVIARGCLARQNVLCRACDDACGRAVIGFALRNGGAPAPVDTRNCNGCGDCVGACPVAAITMQPLSTTT
jgi:ferredoxin-type protein NapF